MTRRSPLVAPLVMCVVALVSSIGWFGPQALGAAEPDATREVFLFIPHTHWEGAVFKTREEYLEMGLPNILRALMLLEKYPHYRFVLDQVCYVRPFLERYPEHAAAFRKCVQDGRLAIVGGTDVMPDVNMPSGESFVRQMLYGKRYYRDALRVDVTVGWQLDTFGHHPQMPQLLTLAGYKSFWTQRGVVDPQTPSEFIWEGLDGTRIPTFWLPLSYAVTYGSPAEWPAFAQFFQQRFDALAPYSRGRGRVGLAGADVCEPEFHLPESVQRFNAEAGAPFELRIAVPTDFEKIVAERTDRPVIKGDFNPIFQGTYSSRIELKQKTREVERVLTSAEKLGAVLQWLGHPADETVVTNAWEPALFNQAHDLMSGVMTDRVYDDTLRGYDYSLRAGRDELTHRLRLASESIDTQGEGTPLVVWNLLGWPRPDLVTARIGITDPEAVDLSLVGPDGQAVPVQLLSEVRASTGALLQAEIAFVARDVPSLGYSVYRAVSSTRAIHAVSTQPTDAALENEHYRVVLDAGSGALTSLVAKGSNWEVLSAPANVVAREEDRGDLWELYHNLEAGFVTNKVLHVPPQAGQAVFSNEPSDVRGTVTCGDVISQFSISRKLGSTEFATTVRLVAGLRRIDVHTRIVNQEKSVRYRALFPTTMSEGECYHEIPFGALARPEGIELPAQNWVDWGNAERGVALLNRGLPGNNAAAGTLMLSLARSTRIQAYGYGGGYEPGMSSDSGYELGKELHFDYALVPHAGSWQESGVYRDGWEFNQPMLALTTACHPGPLPSRWGFLDVAPQNVMVSALKTGPDGAVVLRVYETTGQATTATVRCAAPLRAAEEVNLMEDPGQKLTVAGQELQLRLRPFEIKTILLRFETVRR